MIKGKTKTLITCVLGLMFGCSEKPPVPESEANIYQKAVYYNKTRPAEDRDRDHYRKPAQVLEFAGVQPGDRVVDLLGGGGFYTELLSDIVGPEGQVYLVNSPLFVNFTADKIAARLADNRLENVTRIDGPWDNLGMPDNVDLIWIGLAYHDIYVPRPNNPEFEADPEAFFDQLYAALKPGGKILVIDHNAEQGSGKDHAASLHRIEEDFAKQDFADHGFEFVAALDVLRNPDDDFSKDIWKKGTMHRTDRFIHLYQKPE